jgi:hypothetical protein
LRMPMVGASVKRLSEQQSFWKGSYLPPAINRRF